MSALKFGVALPYGNARMAARLAALAAELGGIDVSWGTRSGAKLQ